jgi:septum formation protein
MNPIILASASKERALMLENLFEIIIKPAHIVETALENENACDLVSRLALEKAQHCATDDKHIIAADTIIEFSNRQLGKPEDKERARETIKSLMNKQFSVWTSTVFYINSKILKQCTIESILECRYLTNLELDTYIESKIWKGKAGAFSISDPNCPMKIIKGDHNAVRGLCLSFINDILSKL